MTSSSTYRVRVRNARQLVVVSANGEAFRRGRDMDDVVIIDNGGMVIGGDGRIVSVGTEAAIAAAYPDDACTFAHDVDATGKVVLPGLVDGHTHPVWSGDRVGEFAMKLAGATYMDIHRVGGGINFTVRHVHESGEEELLRLLMARLDRMLRTGTTLIEGKSGYGLVWDAELKMLRVLHRANALHPIDVVGNYCAAHSVPKGSTADEATVDIVQHQLPLLKAAIDAGEVSPSLIDVFCEKGVFGVVHTEQIIRAGADIAGLKANFHGDELNPLKSAELAGRMRATAVSHLEHVSDEGIDALVANDVVGVLLPTTAYVLRIDPPPARKMIDRNVVVALGSDFNPNAHCSSLPHVMNLACVTMRMTMNESLVACTINAAASMGRSAEYGSLEVGKCGDFILLDAPRWEHLVYQMVDPPIQAIFKKGVLVHGNTQQQQQQQQ